MRWNRPWHFIAVALLFVAVTGLCTLIRTPLYTATARILDFGVAQPDPNVPLRTIFDDRDDAVDRNSLLAERVVARLGLQADQDFLTPHCGSLAEAIRCLLWPDSGETGAKPTHADVVAQHIRVQRVADANSQAGSKFYDVSYTDPDAERAWRIANAYAREVVAAGITAMPVMSDSFVFEDSVYMVRRAEVPTRPSSSCLPPMVMWD